MNSAMRPLLDCEAASDIVAPPRGLVLAALLMLGIALLCQLAASVKVHGWRYDPRAWLARLLGTAARRAAAGLGGAVLLGCAVGLLGVVRLGLCRAWCAP